MPGFSVRYGGTRRRHATEKLKRQVAHLSGSQPSTLGSSFSSLSLSVSHVVLQVGLFSPSFYRFCYRTPLHNSIPSFASVCTPDLDGHLFYCTPSLLNQPSARSPHSLTHQTPTVRLSQSLAKHSLPTGNTRKPELDSTHTVSTRTNQSKPTHKKIQTSKPQWPS